jgi:predicted alpha/beta superfamily hydrolase
VRRLDLALALPLLLALACGDSSSPDATTGGAAGSNVAAAGSGGAGAKAGSYGSSGQSGTGGAATAGKGGAPNGGASNAGSGGNAGAAGGAGLGGSGPGGSSAGGAAGANGGAGGSTAITTTFRVHYPVPAGHALAIRGDAPMLTWMTGAPMKQADPDLWVYATTAITAPAEVKPLLDDATWSRGPNYHVTPGATVDVYPHFTTTQGKVTQYAAAFHSQSLPDDRVVWAYLPPTYLENSTAHFPVVYMHDGQNLFGTPGAFGDWLVDETMDAAAEDGSIREAIVVGVGNTPARIYEYTPTYDASTMDGGGADKYLALLANELKPKIDADLRTLPGRETTALVGSSLGGLVSAYGGLKQPATWGLLGVMSPSTWWDNEVITADVAASKGAPLKALRVYVDSGDSGPSNDDVTQTKKLADTYGTVGYVQGKDLSYLVQAGGMHNEAYWAQRLPGALAFLVGPRPDLGSRPRRSPHRPLSDAIELGSPFDGFRTGRGAPGEIPRRARRRARRDGRRRVRGASGAARARGAEGHDPRRSRGPAVRRPLPA